MRVARKARLVDELLRPAAPSVGAAPGAAVVPVGAGMIWFLSTAPTGWLLADGTSYSKTIFADLWAVVQTWPAALWTASGSTFTMGGLTGRVPVQRQAGDPDFGTLGAQPGSKTHILTTAQMPSHGHGTVAGTLEVVTNVSWGTLNQVRNDSNQTGVVRNQSLSKQNLNAELTQQQGGGQAHPNVQPSVVINWIIKH